MFKFIVTIPTLSKSYINIDIEALDKMDAIYKAINKAIGDGFKIPSNAINWSKCIINNSIDTKL